jgi:hypothetical protein
VLCLDALGAAAQLRTRTFLLQHLENVLHPAPPRDPLKSEGDAAPDGPQAPARSRHAP